MAELVAIYAFYRLQISKIKPFINVLEKKCRETYMQNPNPTMTEAFFLQKKASRKSSPQMSNSAKNYFTSSLKVSLWR